MLRALLGLAQNGTFNNPTFTGQPKGTGVRIGVSRGGVHFIWLSSGTMGNNGALTAITALPRTYSEGAWCLFPAGAIAAGVPAAAAWLWVTFSSATAGTVWNSTYTSGVPTAGTQTAFVTTGPGAFTGVIAATTGPSIQLPANTLGATGELEMCGQWAFTNSAGNKVLNHNLGSTAFGTHTLTTHVAAYIQTKVWNEGVANKQSACDFGVTNTSALFGPLNPDTTGTEDTTTALNVSFSSSRATATDNVVLLTHTASYQA